jgi:hypothetical protein
MKTKLVSALGLALLAASFTFSSSFACSQSPEATAVVLPTVVPESDATVAAQTSTEEVDQPADVSAIEPPPIAESAPVIHSVDAIVVEITQSGTITAPEAIEASEAAQTSITEEVDQPATPHCCSVSFHGGGIIERSGTINQSINIPTFFS